MIARNLIAEKEELVGFSQLLVIQGSVEFHFLVGEKLLEHVLLPGSMIDIWPPGVVVGGEAWHAAEVLLLLALC